MVKFAVRVFPCFYDGVRPKYWKIWPDPFHRSLFSELHGIFFGVCRNRTAVFPTCYNQQSVDVIRNKAHLTRLKPYKDLIMVRVSRWPL